MTKVWLAILTVLVVGYLGLQAAEKFFATPPEVKTFWFKLTPDIALAMDIDGKKQNMPVELGLQSVDGLPGGKVIWEVKNRPVDTGVRVDIGTTNPPAPAKKSGWFGW
jgi:hypothetical protein